MCHNAFFSRIYSYGRTRKGEIVMNEKLQYATMLEIPVNTCNITYKPVRKKRSRRKKADNPEEVKRELLQKVNSAAETETFAEQAPAAEVAEGPSYAVSPAIHTDVPVMPREESKKKRGFTFSAVTLELVIIGVLLAIIFLTNAFYPQSGINTFIKSVFGSEQTEELVDNRLYGEFTPVVAYDSEQAPVIENGMMTIAAQGSVYSPCDGKVAAITADGEGKYTMEIAHSENFKSVIMGLDYAYAAVGDTVYGNIPVGYVAEEGFKMCFMGADGAIITGYQVTDNTVVWAV